MFCSTTDGTQTLSLTPNVPGALSITRFTNFQPFNCFLRNYPPRPTGVFGAIIAVVTMWSLLKLPTSWLPASRS